MSVLHALPDRDNLPLKPQLTELDVARGIVVARRAELEILWILVGLEPDL